MKDIVWHDISEGPPLNTTLLLVTNDNLLCVGSYFRHDREVRRGISLLIYETPSLKIGSTVKWAVLPSKDEIRKENEA